MAKIKIKEHPADLASGNPMFNLKDAKPVDPNWKSTDEISAPSAVTAEDLALERELERIALETPIPDIEPDMAKPLTKEKQSFDHLSEHIEAEYRAAKTLNELEQQVVLAKRLKCDAVDAEPEIIRYYCGPDYSEAHGYFMYKDVKVCFPKSFAGVKAQSSMTVEQKLFGQTKVK